MPMTFPQWRKFRNRILVETGTATGKGVYDALAAGFQEVRSIELDEHWYQFCRERFDGDERIKLWLGASEYYLWDMIADIKEPATFWLDGHYAGNGTAMGPNEFPILQELAIIARHPVKTHTILIDDMRLVAGGTTLFSIEDVERAVFAINPKYTIYYEPGIETGAAMDILVAKE